MNRLTERTMDNVYYSKGKYPPATLCAEMETWEVRECMAKLATYEDTGFEPEQVKQLNDAFKNSQKKLEKAFDDLEALNLAISALEKQLNGGWIPFKTEYDEDYNMDMLQGEIPEEEEEILVTDGENVWSDTFMRDGTDCYLDSGNNLIDKVIAWQPLPEPYKRD